MKRCLQVSLFRFLSKVYIGLIKNLMIQRQIKSILCSVEQKLFEQELEQRKLLE